MSKSLKELLEMSSDDFLLEKFGHFGATRVHIHQWRKGTHLPDDRVIDLLREYLNEPLKPGDPNNPDYSDPAFIPYEENFLKLVSEKGLEAAYSQWTMASPCGCMGPQDGEPFCPCMMTTLTAKKHAKIVPR